MTNQDSAENRALVAAQSISVEVGRLWLSAFADGAREGIATAATCIDQVVKQLRDDYSLDAAVRETSTVMGEYLRDQLRLAALSIPEPTPPTPPWEAR